MKLPMTGLDIFALIILLVVLLTIIGIALALAMAPGRIARGRGHPQADAIAVCGWWGLLTAGVLLPLAWIWAYTKPGAVSGSRAETGVSGSSAIGDEQKA
jgi:hypothetical protein